MFINHSALSAELFVTVGSYIAGEVILILGAKPHLLLLLQRRYSADYLICEFISWPE